MYESAHVEASDVTASSWVGAKTKSRPWLSFVLSNSVPMESHRPLAFHSAAGVSIGRETLWAPTEAMESSMRSVSFRMDLVARGRWWNSPWLFSTGRMKP